MRWALAVILAGVACAGSRGVSKIRYTSTDCPDPAGCEAPTGEAEEFRPPDEDRPDPIVEAAAGAPPPSCHTVGVALTALELGNYASESDEREGLVAKHERACQQAKLDARETECMSMVTESWHVGYCTRKLGAPTQRIQLLTKAQCADLATRLRDRAAQYNYGPTQLRQIEVYQASCEQDGWPVALFECVAQQTYYSYQALGNCHQAMPPWLEQQITDRITAVK